MPFDHWCQNENSPRLNPLHNVLWAQFAWNNLNWSLGIFVVNFNFSYCLERWPEWVDVKYSFHKINAYFVLKILLYMFYNIFICIMILMPNCENSRIKIWSRNLKQTEKEPHVPSSDGNDVLKTPPSVRVSLLGPMAWILC